MEAELDLMRGRALHGRESHVALENTCIMVRSSSEDSSGGIVGSSGSSHSPPLDMTNRYMTYALVQDNHICY